MSFHPPWTVLPGGGKSSRPHFSKTTAILGRLTAKFFTRTACFLTFHALFLKCMFSLIFYILYALWVNDTKYIRTEEDALIAEHRHKVNKPHSLAPSLLLLSFASSSSFLPHLLSSSPFPPLLPSFHISYPSFSPFLPPFLYFLLSFPSSFSPFLLIILSFSTPLSFSSFLTSSSYPSPPPFPFSFSPIFPFYLLLTLLLQPFPIPSPSLLYLSSSSSPFLLLPFYSSPLLLLFSASSHSFLLLFFSPLLSSCLISSPPLLLVFFSPSSPYPSHSPPHLSSSLSSSLPFLWSFTFSSSPPTPLLISSLLFLLLFVLYLPFSLLLSFICSGMEET